MGRRKVDRTKTAILARNQCSCHFCFTTQHVAAKSKGTPEQVLRTVSHPQISLFSYSPSVRQCSTTDTVALSIYSRLAGYEDASVLKCLCVMPWEPSRAMSDPSITLRDFLKCIRTAVAGRRASDSLEKQVAKR